MKDSHIHSGLIEHTYDDIFSIAEKAKEIGLSEITILEHFSPFKIKYPSNSDKSNTIFIDKIPKAYLRRTSIIKQLIKECNLSEKKIGIKIKKSLEVDFHPKFINEIKKLKEFELDYLTLGCHYVEDPEASEENKLLHIGFQENIEYFVKKYGIEELFSIYFKNILAGIKAGLFFVVAHLDFPKKFIKDYDSKIILNQIKPILIEIIKRKIILEVNIKDIDKGIIYPGIEIIKLYKKMGGKNISIGSDSHSIKDLEDSINKRKELDRLFKIEKAVGLQ